MKMITVEEKLEKLSRQVFNLTKRVEELEKPRKVPKKTPETRR